MKKGINTVIFSKEILIKEQNIILKISEDVPYEYWTIDNFLIDLPEEWDYSLVSSVDKGIIGSIIASQKNDSQTHIHHFIVGK
jgi:hypothetical protein